ncbi:AMP-dependent synthetase/ligase [Nocardia tengchongensis]
MSTTFRPQEIEVPASYRIAEDAALTDIVDDIAGSAPDFVAFQVPGADGWTDITAARFAAEVRAVAKGLIASGVQPGDRVGILSSTRYEWTLLDFAIWTAGACTVAIYATSSADQARWILEDSGTRLLIVEHARHQATVTDVAGPELQILRLDEDAVGTLIERGKALDDTVIKQRRSEVGADSWATLIYTAGTTGRPKGVMLTHRNLLAEVTAVPIALSGFITAGDRTLMFLPLAHVFARAISIGALVMRVTVAHTSDWTTLPDQFATYRPQFIPSVPRVFEKLYNTARQRAVDAGKGRLFDLAADTAIAWSEALQDSGPGPWLRLRHALFDRLVYSKLRAALGGRCHAAVSGGGPLGARLGHFFRGAGITVCEGYGLTETSAGITVNTADHIRIGTVGRPIEGHAVRIAADGELLVRGPTVFGGYWNNPEATAASFEDGWFRTGDLGSVDADGYVSIIGRKKEILVTAAGKNVSPAPLEDVLRAHPLVGQCLVVGDGRPFIGVLVTLDHEALQNWRQRHGVDEEVPITELVGHPELIGEINAAVSAANATVSSAESIKKTRILPGDWTEEGGELTPKLSLKRAVVLRKYAAEVDALYE